jgi:hypothetical protein
MESRAIIPKKNERRKGKTEEETWKEREKRLEGLLREDSDPNPKAKGDFDRFLAEMMRRNSR